MIKEFFEGHDTRGEWRPKFADLPPLFLWPLKPFKILKWIIGFPGYLFPWNALMMGISIVVWFFLTPELARMKTFEFGWVTTIYIRNVMLLFIIAGIFHLHFYTRKSQDVRYKYNDKWLRKNHPGFLFRNQTWDNIFWSLISGCGVWSAFEIVTFWMFANGYVPYLEFRNQPLYFILLFLAIPLIRDFHFYLVHRLLHCPLLYKSAHYLHHKNTRIGPWSGLSMHPIEHLLYFTGVILHWFLLSHPLHAIFHLQHAGLSAAIGHTEFEVLEINYGTKFPGPGSYYHYLHHRHFECNYGGSLTMIVDKWFGTFYDGTDGTIEVLSRKKV